MSKSKKTTKKTAAAAKQVPAVKGGKAKVTMTKPDAVNAAMQAVDAAKAKTPKTLKAPKAPKEPKAKKPSGLDAAAQVLRETGKPMGCKEIVEQMLAKDLWTTKGATPSAAIYSGVIREIAEKKETSRFRKVGRGQFEFVK